ncbi:hypothetical protein PISMIDRAFT_688692 [Pisolithus microcarpus 441]|uniref:Uncharacterized protein n=1 Tax=Pisolithus microcarpus 441 TaxID=765257 RepID=A0A0C9YSQ4_9AGAM|nr:hypothetical protein BKA83DRAFT_688692 [Pisolithus microcarpus]KIK13357.1 hypothetical protein PISMIDRAFT_688692 [Pisolithus microcarpus 441]
MHVHTSTPQTYLLSFRAFRLAPGPYPGGYTYSLQWRYQQLSSDAYSRRGRTAPRTVSLSLLCIDDVT